jgi:hypothetical protein
MADSGWTNNPAQNFVNQMLPYSQGNTSTAASLVANMLPYSSGGPMEPGSAGNPTPGPSAEEQAAAARQAALRSGIMDEKSGYLNSAGSQIDQYGQRYGNSITDYLDSIRAGQSNINTMGAKNELARNQGQTGVLGMVGRGIKSTGVMLGNKNAGDSSAAGALAGAYGELGKRQMSNVGNQYELGNMDIANQQTAFDVQKSKGRRDIELGKQEFVTSLLNDVQDKMAQLNARLVDASLPDRIAIEQEKEAIRQRANSTLQQYDQNLASGYGSVNANSIDDRRTEAQRLQQAGTQLGAGAFDFTQEAPMQFQGNAPSGGNLPLFMLPRRRMA